MSGQYGMPSWAIDGHTDLPTCHNMYNVCTELFGLMFPTNNSMYVAVKAIDNMREKGKDEFQKIQDLTRSLVFWSSLDPEDYAWTKPGITEISHLVYPDSKWNVLHLNFRKRLIRAFSTLEKNNEDLKRRNKGSEGTLLVREIIPHEGKPYLNKLDNQGSRYSLATLPITEGTLEGWRPVYYVGYLPAMLGAQVDYYGRMWWNDYLSIGDGFIVRMNNEHLADQGLCERLLSYDLGHVSPLIQIDEPLTSEAVERYRKFIEYGYTVFTCEQYLQPGDHEAVEKEDAELAAILKENNLMSQDSKGVDSMEYRAAYEEFNKLHLV